MIDFLRSIQLSCTNFSDSMSYHSLLDHLRSNFSEFKVHEEIENQYIVRELLPRLPLDAKTALKNDLHSDNRYVVKISFNPSYSHTMSTTLKRLIIESL